MSMKILILHQKMQEKQINRMWIGQLVWVQLFMCGLQHTPSGYTDTGEGVIVRLEREYLIFQGHAKYHL